MTDNKRAKSVFFIEWEDLVTPYYVKCQCMECGKTSYIDCGPTPPSRTSALYHANHEGWRFYDEYPRTLQGNAGLVCPECVSSITGEWPDDTNSLFEHYDAGELEYWLNKKNQKTLEKYDEEHRI